MKTKTFVGLMEEIPLLTLRQRKQLQKRLDEPNGQQQKRLNFSETPVGSKTRQQEDRLSPIINLLYDAVLNDGQWQGIAAAIAKAFDSTSVVLKICGGPLGPQLTSVTDNLRISAREQSWADHWHRNDLWVERSALLDTGQVFTSRSLMPDAQFERTGFYQDWTRRLDIYHMVGVLFPSGHGETGVLGVHRIRAADPYGEADRRQLYALFPHVRRALALGDRLRESELAQSASLEALERIETGVLVVDASCTVLYANRAAEWLLESSLEIRVQGQRLGIDDPSLNNRLARLIREAEQTAAGRVHLPSPAMAVARSDRLPITLLVAPWRATWAPADIAQPAAMIFIRDPEISASATNQTLRELFGLTRAEAVIATAIGEGQSPERIAAALGVGLGTVHTHLKKALAKTGTSRQGALAALVARSVAGISIPAVPLPVRERPRDKPSANRS
ncbi:helix-turn-helix transcriptional regulator [Eoetvoesiella caeni]